MDYEYRSEAKQIGMACPTLGPYDQILETDLKVPGALDLPVLVERGFSVQSPVSRISVPGPDIQLPKEASFPSRLEVW